MQLRLLSEVSPTGQSKREEGEGEQSRAEEGGAEQSRAEQSIAVERKGSLPSLSTPVPALEASLASLHPRPKTSHRCPTRR